MSEQLDTKGWFPVAAIPLDGRGRDPIAYRLTWAGKAVLFSGRIPVELSQDAGTKLIADLTRPPGDIRGYFTSLTRLHREAPPDLWLPAIPTHGQNANLYDGHWTRVIEDNLLVVRTILADPRRR
jgi:hypothetical protein